MQLKTTRFRARIAYVTALLAALLCVVPITLSLVTVTGLDSLLRDHIANAEAAAVAIVAQRVRQNLLLPVSGCALLMSSNLDSAASSMQSGKKAAACYVGNALAQSKYFSKTLATTCFDGGLTEFRLLQLPISYSIITSPRQAGDGSVFWVDLCVMRVNGTIAASTNTTTLPRLVGPKIAFSPSACTTFSSHDNSTGGWWVHAVCPIVRTSLLSNSSTPLYVRASALIPQSQALLHVADPMTVTTNGLSSSSWIWDGVAVYDQATGALVMCLVAGAVVATPETQTLCSAMKAAAVLSANDLVSDGDAASATDPSGFTINMEVVQTMDLTWVAITATGNTAAAPVVRARGVVLVVTFCITAMSIFLLVMMLRLLTQPLRPIVEAVKALTKMRLDDIGLMEASMVTEIVEIQKSVSYLAIRLYHYMRFLPDPAVLAGLTQSDAISDDSEEDDTRQGAPTRGGMESPLLQKAAKHGAEHLRQSTPSTRPSGKSKAAVHTITVDVLYESRRAGRNSPDRRFMTNKSAHFVFSYKVHDPVFAKLVRTCREQLKEHPGELLLVFAHTNQGLRQLVCDEDVFCAFELDAEKDPFAGPSISLTVRKGSCRNFLPLAIAAGTFLSVASRLVLCVQRLSHPSVDVQFLGLVLLCCLGMQVAQNTLIALYLIRRFAALDTDFRSWLAVAQYEAIISVLCGSLNITNITVMSCHVRLSKQLRLNAPLSNSLLEKIAKYSLVGFIIGDLLPFTFILIDVVLKDKYEDPFVILSTVLSIFSVASILVQHGLRRFVMSDTMRGNSRQSSSPTQQTRRALLLCRREVSLVRLAVSEEALLMEFLTPPLVEVLCDSFYSTIANQAKRFGGAVSESRGLSCAVSFNAQSALLQHTATALEFFLAVSEAVERHVLHSFFTGEKFMLFLSNTLATSTLPSPSGMRELPPIFYASPPAQLQMLFHERHRLVGSLVTGEMAMGLAGSLTSQTMQHVGLSARLSSSLCQLNEWYGSTLLTNEEAAKYLDWTNSTLPVFRRIDRLQPGRSLFIPCLTNQVESQPMDDDEGPDLEGLNMKGASNPVLWQDIDPSTRSAQEAPKIVVYEAVVNNFAVGMTNLLELDPLHQLSSVHQNRCVRPTRATAEAVKLFDDALELLLSLNNSTPLSKYVQSHPEDIVAGRVLRWAQFLPAPNRADAVKFPRILTSLGVSRHSCESNTSMMPTTAADEASAVMRAMSEKQAEKERRFRPSRSQRRELQTGSGVGDGEVAGRVLERMLVTDTFHVAFQKRSTTDIDPATL